MRLSATLILSALAVSAFAKTASVQRVLTLNEDSKTREEIVMSSGKIVPYYAIEKQYYVTNVEDSTYQYLNIYIPENHVGKMPVFIRTYIGGYMESAAASPQLNDASGRALQEGYALVIPGSRGRNSTIAADKAYTKKHKGTKVGDNIYTGRAPAALLDLKAAIRYIRHFADKLNIDTDKIIIDGTSAGGAMASLIGATGNSPDYTDALKAMGAADERDDVNTAVCFCPITDLDHADAAYEWLFRNTDSRLSDNDEARKITEELAEQFPQYINSLNLRAEDGSAINADNYLEYIKKEIIKGAQIAKNAGADIPDSLGFKFSDTQRGRFVAPINGGRLPHGINDKMMRPVPIRLEKGEYITDLDMESYLNYVVSTQALKSQPAFDALNVIGRDATGENEVFGDYTGSKVNFTKYSNEKNGKNLSESIAKNVHLMNPMNYIGKTSATTAQHWYIRHGARDRDTAFAISFNLATLLKMQGIDVNYLLSWNRPHSGDYALDELFSWLNELYFK